MPYEDFEINHLIINKLSQAKYNELSAAGQIVSSQIYIIEDKTLDARNTQIINVGRPIEGTDGANKEYVDEQISSIDSKVSAISSFVSAIPENVDTLSGNINSVSSFVSSIPGKIDYISSFVSGIPSDIETISSFVSGIPTDIQTISAFISATPGNVETISGNLNTVSLNLNETTANLNVVSSGLTAYVTKDGGYTNETFDVKSSNIMANTSGVVFPFQGFTTNNITDITFAAKNLPGKISSDTLSSVIVNINQTRTADNSNVETMLVNTAQGIALAWCNVSGYASNVTLLGGTYDLTAHNIDPASPHEYTIRTYATDEGVSAQGTRLFIDGVSVLHASGLRFPNCDINKIGLGSYVDVGGMGPKTTSGMVVSSITVSDTSTGLVSSLLAKDYENSGTNNVNSVSIFDGTVSYVNNSGETISYSLNHSENTGNEIAKKSDITDYSGEVSYISSFVSALPGKIDAVSGNVGEISSFVSGIPSNINAISSFVSGIPSDIQVVSSFVSGIPSDIQVVSAEVSSVPGKIETISSFVSGIPSDVETISSFVSGIPEDVQAVSGVVSSLPGKIEAISGFVSAIPTDVQTISSFVSGIPSNIETISSFVSGIPSDIETISSFVSGIPSDVEYVSSFVSGIPTDIQTVSGNLDNLSGEVSSKAENSDVSTLSATVVNLSQRGYVARDENEQPIAVFPDGVVPQLSGDPLRYTLGTTLTATAQLEDRTINRVVPLSSNTDNIVLSFPSPISGKVRDLLVLVTNTEGNTGSIQFSTPTNSVIYGDGFSSSIVSGETWLYSITEVANNEFYTRAIKMGVVS